MKISHLTSILFAFSLGFLLSSCADKTPFDISTYRAEESKNNQHSLITKTNNINQIESKLQNSCESDDFQIQYIKDYYDAYNVSYVCPIGISRSENQYVHDLFEMTTYIADGMYFDAFGHKLDGNFDQAWYAVARALISRDLSVDLADKEEGVLLTHFSVDIDYAVRYIAKLTALSDEETFLAVRAYAYRTCMTMLDDSCPEPIAVVSRHKVYLRAMELLADIQEGLQSSDGELQPDINDLQPYSIFDRHQLVYEPSLNLDDVDLMPSNSVVGRWSGMIDYPGFSAFPVHVVIDARNNGFIDYPTLNCSGKVRRAATEQFPEGKRLSQLLFVQTFETGQLVCGKQYAFYLTPVGPNSDTLLFECCTPDGLASVRATLRPEVF